ncbi:MAG: MerR family transcriptional regulator [Acidimicrobiales bacterium]
MADGSTDDTQRMRIDALAGAAGVATTTIRLYQQKGLLPGPELEGRTGWYGPPHLARLRLISRLQADGFSLAGIGKLLDSWQEGRALTDLVGVERQLDELLHQRAPVVVDPLELAERFPAGSLTPELFQRAMSLGLVALTDTGQVEVPDRRFLDTGAELAALGVPLHVVLDEWEDLRRQMDEVAQRFVAVFEEHLLPPSWRHDLDADGVRSLAATLAKLQHHAGTVLLAALDASMADLAGRRLAELVPADPAAP